MINRLILAKIRRAARSVLLLGPRQTGKSTIMQAAQPDLEINLMREGTFLEFSSDSEALEARLAATSGARLIFIDEIQRLPSLMNTLQAEIDASKGKLKFLLTGSSARKLRRGEANLLPGRLQIYYMGPLVAAELNYSIATRYALAVGTLPDPYLLKDSADSQKLLMDYASTYLKEEIQVEALTRNLSGFARFMQAAAASSGQYLDFSKLSRRAKVPRQTAVRYFEILEDTLIAQRLECVDPGVVSRADLVRHPRYFFFDVGVLNGLLQNFSVSPDRIGMLFEHLLLTQLVASAQAHDSTFKIWNFRTRGGLEVDFVFQTAAKLYLIEAKACTTTAIHAADVSPIQQALSYFPTKPKAFIACLDGPDRKIAGIPVLGWQKVLKEIGL